VILHVVLLRFHAHTTPIQVEDARRALLGMRGAIPGVRGVTFGPNLAPDGAEWPYVLIVALDDVASVERYLAHPLHQDLLAKYIRPVLAARLAADAEAP
jgi:Stress responsive A/B Barrel Domain.